MPTGPKANSLHTVESLRRRTSWCCCSQPVSLMLATVLEWLTDFLTGAIMESRKAARSKAVANPPPSPPCSASTCVVRHWLSFDFLAWCRQNIFFLLMIRALNYTKYVFILSPPPPLCNCINYIAPSPWSFYFIISFLQNRLVRIY